MVFFHQFAASFSADVSMLVFFHEFAASFSAAAAAAAAVVVVVRVVATVDCLHQRVGTAPLPGRFSVPKVFPILCVCPKSQEHDSSFSTGASLGVRGTSAMSVRCAHVPIWTPRPFPP